ncbi:MAG: glycolate oxidase subunit GlcF [Gammaproteobacteria bacterium]|nr:glycolate oxidase subunit GlcF [Gammaproteobacteria bacterium]
MQTRLIETLINTPEGKAADRILRKCVHCGFCLATCPTYQLTGNELESPRGRIYLIKQVLEGQPATAVTQAHLDHCLGCLNCETTCPSGVEYGELADLGKQLIERQVKRPWYQRVMRWVLLQCLPYRKRFAWMLRLAQYFKLLLPTSVRAQIPVRVPHVSVKKTHSSQRKTRTMLLLDGCVQPGLTPRTNQAAQQVFGQLGIDLVSAAQAGCCGAMSYHLQQTEAGRDFARQNIDVWWPFIEQGAEAIITTASGCGAFIKSYGEVLAGDPRYREKANRVAEIAKDVVEVLAKEDLAPLRLKPVMGPIAFHPPCSLQHAQNLSGCVERLLTSLGFQLTAIAEKHLCCGSAGTYSIFNPVTAQTLRQRKLAAIESQKPQLIATANVGCQHHLQVGTGLEVIHWVELLVRSSD